MFGIVIDCVGEEESDGRNRVPNVSSRSAPIPCSPRRASLSVLGKCTRDRESHPRSRSRHPASTTPFLRLTIRFRALPASPASTIEQLSSNIARLVATASAPPGSRRFASSAGLPLTDGPSLDDCARQRDLRPAPRTWQWQIRQVWQPAEHLQEARLDGLVGVDHASICLPRRPLRHRVDQCYCSALCPRRHIRARGRRCRRQERAAFLPDVSACDFGPADRDVERRHCKLGQQCHLGPHDAPQDFRVPHF